MCKDCYYYISKQLSKCNTVQATDVRSPLVSRSQTAIFLFARRDIKAVWLRETTFTSTLYLPQEIPLL